MLEWNPWWKGSYHFQKVRRDLFFKIKNWIDRKEIISILGVRRSGKTTLLFETIDYLINEKKVNSDNIFFIKADDDRVEKKDLIKKLLDEYLIWRNPQDKIYIFIDEVHEIPEWQKTLKRIYDLNDENKKIFISGSNASLLKEELSYLLTGRFAYFELFPFSFREFIRAQNISVKNETDILRQKNTLRNLLLSYIEYGGFPEIVLEKDKNRKDELLQFYFESILYRDIVKRKNIRNVEKLDRLVKWYLQNISVYANYDKLGKICDLSTDTIGEYTRFLEDAYLVFVINILAYSVKKQFVNPKKIYCVDPGIRRIVGFIFSEDSGRIYENIVFTHLKQTGRDIYYWKNKNECDFITKNKEIVEQVIQVSYDIEKSKDREIKGLIGAMEKFDISKGLIITQNYESKKIINEKEIVFKPLWKWLLYGQNSILRN
ncbi:MAG: hypothetical protein AYK22_01655 [Thermoplasmatales archaeon SG8-52-3]|nr:MAG: hypothetical protein AYK22_01655 [Thermoplasmatales archaeon SG8-52-3]